MNLRKILVPVVLLIVLGSVLFLAGCPAPERRPAPPPPNTVPSPNTRDMGRNPNVTPPPAPRNQMQNEDANVIPIQNMIERMPEVNKAWVVLSGNTAFVGIDVKENVSKNRINTLKTEIAKKVKQHERSVNNNITNVVVTADPNIVTRIKRVAEGIANGRPISSFANEIAEITRRLAPTNR